MNTEVTSAPAEASPEIDNLSIAAITTRVASPLAPLTPVNRKHWVLSPYVEDYIRHLAACYRSAVGSNTLLPVTWWETRSVQSQGKQCRAEVPLWVIASTNEENFRQAHSSPAPSCPVDPDAVELGSEPQPYRWHMAVGWDRLNSQPRELVAQLKQGVPASYRGYDRLDPDLDCSPAGLGVDGAGALLSTGNDVGTTRARRATPLPPIKPISLLPSGERFQAHKFAEAWCRHYLLSDDLLVKVTYSEVATIDGAAVEKAVWMPLRSVVTHHFKHAHESKAVPATPESAGSERHGWTYPHRDQLQVHWSTLQDWASLPATTQQALQAGMPADYQGTDSRSTDPLAGPQEKEQTRQLALLDESDKRVATLLASAPTFDRVLHDRLIAEIKARFSEERFPGLHQRVLDPNALYINLFTIESDGTRSPTSSKTFMEAMREGLITDTVATYFPGAVVFSDSPERLEDADSLFGCPANAKILHTLATALYVANPSSNSTLHDQLTAAYQHWRKQTQWGSALDNPQGLTAEAFLAHEFELQYQSVLALYKTDRPAENLLTSTERLQQQRDNRLLDSLLAHPAQEAHLKSPVAQVHAVKLVTGDGTPQKWPGAMVLTVPGQTRLFLYSREGGLQKFASQAALKEEVQPRYAGSACAIQEIGGEMLGSVFEQAARDLFDQQSASLLNALHDASNAPLAIKVFVQKLEAALVMPLAGIEGLVLAHNRDAIEYMRPAFYKTATRARQKQYRTLEKKIVAAQGHLSELTRDIPTLNQFARQQAREYLRKSYPGLDPDPDRMVIRFDVPEVEWHHWMTIIDRAIFGDPSHAMSLTELVINNLPAWKATASKDIVVLMPTKVRDSDGDELVNPANGYHIVLGVDYIEALVKACDVDKHYRALLHETLQGDTPASRAICAAAQTMTLLNMKFKGLEAALKDDSSIFKSEVSTAANGITLSEKRILRWLDALLLSPEPASRMTVDGKAVYACRLFLGNQLSARALVGHSPDPESIDGVVVFSDHLEAMQIQGPVGVYFPESPDGNDVLEFADLKAGITELLQSEEWQGYFSQRIATANKSDIKRLLGLTGAGPVVRCLPMRGNFITELVEASVRFQIRHADHRSRSNAEVELQTRLNLALTTAQVLPTVSTLGVVGFRAATGALRTFNAIRATGLLPQDKGIFPLVYKATEGGRKVLAPGPMAMAAARAQMKPFFNAPVRQPDGRFVYELGGKRPASSALTPQPGSSRPRLDPVAAVPAPARRIADAIRRPGSWDNAVMDLVPSLMTELPEWPEDRALLIIDEISTGKGWSVRYLRGQDEVPHSTILHPERADSDVLLRRIGQNHYQIWTNDSWVDVPADGDCFFNAVAGALDDVAVPGTYSGLALRTSMADYIDQHPQVDNYVVLPRTPLQQALFEVGHALETILGYHAFAMLTRIINGHTYEAQLAAAMASHPGLVSDWPTVAHKLIAVRAMNNRVLPVQVLPRIEQYLEPLGLFRPLIGYLSHLANWSENREILQLLWTSPTGDALVPAEVLQRMAVDLPPRGAAGTVAYADQDVRAFLDNTLLPGPQRSEGIEALVRLLADRGLSLNREVKYILLEYGLAVEELTAYYQILGLDDSGRPYVPDQDEIDEFLEDYLAFFKRHPKPAANEPLFASQADLLRDLNRARTAEMNLSLLVDALEGFPDLRARADILLESDVFGFHLGWTVNLEELTFLIRDPLLSNARLRMISEYLETRAGDMQAFGRVDIGWMRPLDDRNVQDIVERAARQHQHPNDPAASNTLLEFVAQLRQEALTDIFAMSHVTAAFTPSSATLSNSRMALLLETADLFPSLSRHPHAVARQLWNLLIAPEDSNQTVRLALGNSAADALRDLAHFTEQLRRAREESVVD